VKVVPADELASYIGSETGRSSWLTIDQDRIDRFAEVTEDRQWIHVDREAAVSGPFGAPIAHGFLTLSLLSYLTSETSIGPSGAMMMINYGSNKVRFLNPVRVGSRIRAVSTLADVTDKAPGQILITSSVVVEIEGEDKPALVADILSLAVMAQPT
jgi:acyl dehydratase